MPIKSTEDPNKKLEVVVEQLGKKGMQASLSPYVIFMVQSEFSYDHFNS